MEFRPKDLREKSLIVLEWPRLLNRLAERALSPRGNQLCHKTRLATTVEGARRAIEETSEMADLFRKVGSVPLGRFEDIEDLITRCTKGAGVKPEELRDISSMLELARLARGFLRNMRDSCPLLWERAQAIEEMKDLKIAINRAVDEEGRIKENATPELKKRLQSLRDQRAAVITRMEEFMRNEGITSYLQDSYYTQRGNRYVLPVKAENRSQIEGIVHDSSQSGQTLFIEPRQFIDANNRLKMAELEVDQEIERILQELVNMARGNADKLRIDLEILTELDVIYARGRLALDLNATAPMINDRGIINLKGARHPHLILKPMGAVSNNVLMGDDLSAIVISGPNTGGKTVMLKTIGLCALMAKAGLHIPAEPQSEMALFIDVLADIGDEQNIEENLSTFSGHILNIAGIIETAQPGSLVLLDELVTSTDPAEGSALAEAILHRLVERKSKVITTTHYTNLKAYAEAHPGFANASFQFDSVSLKPTYKLIQGVPGRSSALEIATRLGMEAGIIERARSLIDSSDMRLEELLGAIQEQHTRLDSEKQELEGVLKLASELKNEQIKLRDKLRELERDFRRNFRTKLSEEVGKARDQIKEILVSLDKERSRKAAGEARKQLREVEQKFRDAEKIDGETIPTSELKPGDNIVVSHLDVRGILIDDPTGKNKVRIQMGKISLEVPVESIRGVLKGAEPDTEETLDWGAVHRKKALSISSQASEKLSSTRLDLRGYRADEALDEVERFLDRAVLANAGPIEIIHGHGTGTLKKLIREHLNKSPYVTSWKPAELTQGGDGVTIVELKQDA